MIPMTQDSSSIVSTISESTYDDASESQSSSLQNEEAATTATFPNVYEQISIQSLIKQIQIEKKEHIYSVKFICITTQAFIKIARDDPLMTTLKCLALVLALGCLHPTIVGSVACLTGYRIENYNDLYTSDLNTTTSASILFSNSGQGITFLVQEIQLTIVPSFLLFKNVFNKPMCQIIRNIYQKHLSSIKNEQAKTVLYEEANHELAYWDGFLAETDEINGIMEEIAENKKKMLSYRNIVCVTMNQFIRKAKKFPLLTIAKTSLVGITALAMHPVIIGTIGCLNSYRAGNPNDLYSSDPVAMYNAVNIFSNTGHIVEYTYTGLGLSAGAISLIFDRKKAIRKIINDIYDTKIHRPSLSENTKKFLRARKRHELTNYM